MNFKDKLTYRTLNRLSIFTSKLSEEAREKLARRLASFFYYFVPIRKNQALNNIKKAFPKKNSRWIKKQLKGTYKIVTNNFIDFLSISKSSSKIRFRIKNQNILDDAISENKGILLITGHFGLWEKWGCWFGKNNYDIWGVIQKQANKGADLFFKEIRESYGMNHIYRKSSVNKIYSLINNNKIIILASDQNAKKRGVIVDFFGNETSVPKGAALFHLRTNVPLIFSVGHKAPDGTIVISFEKINVESKTIEGITQDYTNKLEQKIRQYPDHYFWFHRKWNRITENEQQNYSNS